MSERGDVCVHLRGPAGRAVPCPAACPLCAGDRQARLYSCALGRLCLPVGYAPGVLCCQGCAWREAPNGNGQGRGAG